MSKADFHVSHSDGLPRDTSGVRLKSLEYGFPDYLQRDGISPQIRAQFNHKFSFQITGLVNATYLSLHDIVGAAVSNNLPTLKLSPQGSVENYGTRQAHYVDVKDLSYMNLDVVFPIIDSGRNSHGFVQLFASATPVLQATSGSNDLMESVKALAESYRKPLGMMGINYHHQHVNSVQATKVLFDVCKQVGIVTSQSASLALVKMLEADVGERDAQKAFYAGHGREAFKSTESHGGLVSKLKSFFRF